MGYAIPEGLVEERVPSPGVSARIPASTRIYEDLRNRIINFELPPGHTLSRPDLAQHYQVSQTPVREALLRLEADGLVETYPQSRTVVSRIDISEIHEAHFLRVATETEVVRHLAETPDAPAVTKARSILKMQQALIGDLDSMGMFHRLDETFHQTMFAGVGQLGLHDLVKTKCGHMVRARRLDLPREGKMQHILEEHEDILAAIEKGDPDLAMAMLRKHLTGTITRMMGLKQEHPDYFKD
jgi:DNA-binding GntR family transcriptional regulator